MVVFLQIAFIIVVVRGVVIIPGDVQLVGMFAIHERDGANCGSQVLTTSVMSMEAVKWYIRQLNTYADLPVTIGFSAVETCELTTKAAEHAIALMDKVLKNESYIIGVVGPELSSEAEVVSSFLSSVPHENILSQVGYSTTAASLSDAKKYPNFVRVIPNDAVQIETMIKAMIELKWTRVAVVYEEDAYGQGAVRLLQQKATEQNICVSLSRGLSIENGINTLEIANTLNDIVIGNRTRPTINGIIFIGGYNTARTIFITLKNSDFATVPIVMLSEGLGFDERVFKELDGRVISQSKGSLALSPPFIEVTEFLTHWKSIFTNTTVFQAESSSNTWLQALNFSVSNCIDGQCLLQPAIISAFGKQSLYVQYAIVAAHALIKAFLDVRSKHCVSMSGLCSSFHQAFRPAEVLDTLKRIEIDLKTDFRFRLDSFKHYTSVQSFDSNGDIVQAATSTRYQIFNFRQTNPRTGDFGIIKIGDLLGDNLKLDFDALRDYDNQGLEKLWPEVRTPQCLVETKCLECIAATDIYENFIHDPGDLYVIGMVPMFDSSGIDSCRNIRTKSGYQTAESIRFAAEKVNTKAGDYIQIFEGIRIGTVILNSCNNRVVVQRKLHDIYKNGITFKNGTSIDLKDRIIGFVGDVGSSVSIAAAEVLSKLMYVQISAASTSPSLSDRAKYPYFMRVVTPDDYQAKAIIAVVKQLSANFVQIVHSTDAYGIGGRDKIKEAASLDHICVINEIPVETNGNIYAIYEELRKNKHAQIVIMFIGENIQQIVATLTSQMTRGEFIFLGSETWATKADVLKGDRNQALLGSFTVSPEINQNSELRSHIQNIKPIPYTVNPWLLAFLQAKYQCYFNYSFDKTPNQLCPDNQASPDFALDSWDTSAFIATRSLLLGASEFFHRTCGSTVPRLCLDYKINPMGLIQEIIKTKYDFDGSGNPIKVFNENGDGNIGYRIYNIQKDVDDPLKLTYREVGRYQLEDIFTFDERKLVYPVGSMVTSTCPNEQACAKCFNNTNTDNTATSDQQQKRDAVVLTLGLLLGLASTTVIALIVVIVIIRKKIALGESDSGYITPCYVSRGMRQETLGRCGYESRGTGQETLGRCGYESRGTGQETLERCGYESRGTRQETLGRCGYESRGTRQETLGRCGYESRGTRQETLGRCGYESRGTRQETLGRCGYESRGTRQETLGSEGDKEFLYDQPYTITNV